MKSFAKVRIKESQCSPCIQRQILLRLVVPVLLTFMFWRLGIFCGSLGPPFCLEEGHGDCLFPVIRDLWPYTDFYLYASFTVTLPCMTLKYSWSGPSMYFIFPNSCFIYEMCIHPVYDITGVYYLESLWNFHPCSRDLQILTRQSCQQTDLT